MIIHVSEHCVCLVSVVKPLLETKFNNIEINYIEHKLPDEIYSKENFEEQIEYSSYKKVCHIINQEYIFQPSESIITFSSGIKKILHLFR